MIHKLLVGVFILALFLRFYNLAGIPNGFNQDEAAIGYNAYSILQTGKDEYGKPFPLYFKSFDDHKLPVYIYLTTISENFLGLNVFAVRLPSALFGSLTVLMIFFVIKELTKNSTLALLTAFFLAINPWHIFLSRAAFEDNVGLGFAIAGVWMFLLAVRTKKWIYFLPSMLGFALSLYSYNVTRLLSPALLASLVFLNWKSIKEIPLKIKILVIGFFVVLLSPFFLTLFGQGGASSAQGALIIGNNTTIKGLEMRSYLFNDHMTFIGKVFFNKYVYLIWQYLQNLVGSLATPFYFITGSPEGAAGIGNNGTFYLFEFPLIIIGLVTIVRKKQKNLTFILVWAIIAWLTLSLSEVVPHATRGYFLVIPFEVFSALGLITLFDFIRKYKNIYLKISMIAGISMICLYSILYFAISYTIRFPLFYASQWKQQDKEVSTYVSLNEHKYNKIIFDTTSGFRYTSLAFYTAYPPAKFQQLVKRPYVTSGISYIDSYDKYEWKSVDWGKDAKPGILIITTPGHYPDTFTPMKTFYYPTIPVVLVSDDIIYQTPSTPIAYVAIEGKAAKISTK